MRHCLFHRCKEVAIPFSVLCIKHSNPKNFTDIEKLKQKVFLRELKTQKEGQNESNS